MKLTVKKLTQIIREEVENITKEDTARKGMLITLAQQGAEKDPESQRRLSTMLLMPFQSYPVLPVHQKRNQMNKAQVMLPYVTFSWQMKIFTKN